MKLRTELFSAIVALLDLCLAPQRVRRAERVYAK